MGKNFAPFGKMIILPLCNPLKSVKYSYVVANIICFCVSQFTESFSPLEFMLYDVIIIV